MHFVPHLKLSLAYFAVWLGRQHTRQSLVGYNERILLQIKELFALLGTKNIELLSQVFDLFLQILDEFI